MYGRNSFGGEQQLLSCPLCGEVLATKGWEGSKDRQVNYSEFQKEDGQVLCMTGKLDSARGRPYKTHVLLHSRTVERKRGLKRSGGWCKRMDGPILGERAWAAHAGDTEGPLVRGLRLGPALGPDLGGHTPHLTASIVGAAPERRPEHRGGPPSPGAGPGTHLLHASR